MGSTQESLVFTGAIKKNVSLFGALANPYKGTREMIYCWSGLYNNDYYQEPMDSAKASNVQ